MAKIITTDEKFLTGDNHPQLQIGNKLYLVDDRRSTLKKIQEIQTDKTMSQTDKEDEMLILALGKEQFDELVTDEISVQDFNELTFLVMSAITGESVEELKKAARNAKN